MGAGAVVPVNKKAKHDPFDVPVDLDGKYPLPPDTIDGKANPEYYRILVKRQVLIQEEHSRQGLPYIGLDPALKGIERMCEYHGLDFKSIADARTDAQIAEDTMRLIIETPGSVWSALDREIDVLWDFFHDAADQGREAILKRQDEAREEGCKKALTPEEVRLLRQEGKAWISRLTKIRRLREMARKPSWTTNDKLQTLAEEATHTLRFMAYVGRTSIKDRGNRGTQMYCLSPRRMKFGKWDVGHHIWMSLAYWEARNGVYFYATGVQKNVCPYEGVMCVLPPGMGKTDVGVHERALAICLNPMMMTAMIHSKSDMAERMMTLLTGTMSPNTDAGQRLRALFPNTPNFRKKPIASGFDLDVNITRKSPTATAAGVGERASGSDLDELYIDDPVDQKEAKEETSRKTTHERIHGTWMTRMRGKRRFWVWNTTLWHDDDTSSRMIKLLTRKKVWFVLYIDGAGGKEHDFCPVWEDSGWTASRYKAEYEKNPRDYMTIFGCDPTNETLSIVRKLALYAPTRPNGLANEQHDRFLSGCRRYMSIDPAATAKKTSDASGVVYAGLGEVERKTATGASESWRRIRILGAAKKRTAPTEVMDFVASFHRGGNRIDCVLIETVGGMAMFADQMEQRYPELPIQKITPRLPGQGLASKEARLKHCQMMLDDSLAGQGIKAVVEWPGVWKRGTAETCDKHPMAAVVVEPERLLCGECGHEINRLVLDDGMDWLAEEVLKFGHAEDNGLDALTQLCIHLWNDVQIGGVYTAGLLVGQAPRDPRLVQLLGEWNKKASGEDIIDAEYRILRSA